MNSLIIYNIHGVVLWFECIIKFFGSHAFCQQETITVDIKTNFTMARRGFRVLLVCWVFRTENAVKFRFIVNKVEINCLCLDSV